MKDDKRLTGVELVIEARRHGVTVISLAELESIDNLRDDNARLRGLIKQVEFSPYEDIHACPWCSHVNRHNPDCPAFTPDGEVK